MVRDVVRDVDINRYPQHLFQGRLKIQDVEEGDPPYALSWYGHEEVEVAALDVFASANGAEYPDANETAGLDCLTNHLPFTQNGIGWFHVLPSHWLIRTQSLGYAPMLPSTSRQRLILKCIVLRVATSPTSRHRLS